MHELGNVKLPPPQIIIFNILKNIQETNRTLQTIFNDKHLSVEPMIFQFGSNLAIITHGDYQYNLAQILKYEP